MKREGMRERIMRMEASTLERSLRIPLLALLVAASAILVIVFIRSIASSRSNPDVCRYQLTNGADYRVECVIEDGVAYLTYGTQASRYEVKRTDAAGTTVTYFLDPVVTDGQDDAKARRLVARRFTVPKAAVGGDSVVGLWEDRVQYEFFRGGRSVEVRSVELFADGTGSYQVSVGEEQAFDKSGEGNLSVLYTHELRWSRQEAESFAITDEDMGVTLFLSVLE